MELNTDTSSRVPGFLAIMAIKILRDDTGKPLHYNVTFRLRVPARKINVSFDRLVAKHKSRAQWAAETVRSLMQTAALSMLTKEAPSARATRGTPETAVDAEINTVIENAIAEIFGSKGDA
jgi:hypothetical protein